MTIGEKIRQIRKKKKLTLKTVSQKTDLSIAFLSQLETNKCNATMATLRKISDVLQIHPSILFEYEDVLIENKSKETINFEYKNLANNEYSAFTPLKVKIKPNMNISETVTHLGHEFVYCLSGELTLVVGNQQYKITEGKSYMYNAAIPHYWYNNSDKEVEFLVVNEEKYK